jgi:hypothetical protein
MPQLGFQDTYATIPIWRGFEGFSVSISKLST